MKYNKHIGWYLDLDDANEIANIFRNIERILVCINKKAISPLWVTEELHGLSQQISEFKKTIINL